VADRFDLIFVGVARKNAVFSGLSDHLRIHSLRLDLWTLMAWGQDLVR
jgi:hypothetical protein